MPAIRTPFCPSSANSWLAAPWWVNYWLVSWRVFIVRDKQDEGIKEMCSTGLSFGRSKLLQSCSNFTDFTLKPKLEPTEVACLAGRDAQEVLYTGFVQPPSRHSKRLRFLPDICNADIQKTSFFANPYTVLNGVLNGLQRKRVEALVKTIRWAFWQLFIILLYFHYSRLRLGSVLFFLTITVLDEVVR